MLAARAVTVIQPTISKSSHVNVMGSEKRKRVAAYARVSTGNEEQLSSYEAQVDYYTKYIKANNEWEFVETYTDEGISATNTKKRGGFNRMIADALSGKIDLILTKSVSRFARNTVDTLTTVRKLKEKGIEVYFEKENIYTLDSKGELLITIMSSLAQEESRSISENITWGQRKRFADGKVSLPYKQFLGYEKGEGGLPRIVESEAKVVRYIYKLFLEGKAPSGIARDLVGSGIPTPSGKVKWSPSTIQSILTNEKYKGDAILQKNFTVDFLTKKMKVNEGEVPQYYVENSHPAIISSQVFDLVQYEFNRRKADGVYTSSAGCFSSKIICGECGGVYGSKVWHSTDKYRRTIWQCNNKFKSDKICSTPHFSEPTLKGLFLKAFNQLITTRQEIMENCEMIKRALIDTTQFDNEAEDLKTEIAVTTELICQRVNENACTAIDQGEYINRYEGLVSKYERDKDRLQKIVGLLQDQLAKRERIDAFIIMLSQQDVLLSEFDESLCIAFIDHVIVRSADDIQVIFRDGTVINA